MRIARHYLLKPSTRFFFSRQTICDIPKQPENYHWSLWILLVAWLQTAFIPTRLWDIPLCAAGILPLLDNWMVVLVAYTFLRWSFTNRCDYLINTRAKRKNGEVGKTWRRLTILTVDYILTVLEGIRLPM